MTQEKWAVGETLLQSGTEAGRTPLEVSCAALRDSVVERSLAHCRMVTRNCARNFYYGLKLLPEPKRSALCAVYAFMRACDDLADDCRDVAGATGNEEVAQQQLEQIELFRSMMDQILDSTEPPSAASSSNGSRIQDMWPGFWYTAHQYEINRDYLHAMLDGQLMDVRDYQYQTFEDLYKYCYKVASVVGLICVDIWGTVESEQVDNDAIRMMAEYRGIAFQLTNILRDLVEDARRGRIYLPEDEIQQYGFDVRSFTEQLISGQPDERFEKLMDFQIKRAREYYRKSDELERYIDPMCRPTSWAMSRIYRYLLEKIANEPRRVLAGRVKLNAMQKMTIAMSAAWRGKVSK